MEVKTPPGPEVLRHIKLPQIDGSRTMSIKTCAARYGVSRTTIYRAIRKKQLKIVKIFNRTLILVEDAEDWIKSRRR